MSQTSSLKHSIFEYNPQNRMVRSRVIDDEARTISSTRYGYDVLGRRTLVQDNNAATLRTLYDGLGFDVVKESPIYSNGGFTDTYNIGIQYSSSGRATGERYRYLDDGVSATSEKYQYIEDNACQTVSSRYTGERTMLYAHGSPVAVNRASGTRGYLGTDILGSTRSVTDNHGVQESYYDYDIFGSPVAGDFTTGADYGYLGKPYDSITGLYNYGYRDYSPQTVRFTTVDPIRDGANWFAYVNNDPVNYIDLWGLLASDSYTKKSFNAENQEADTSIDLSQNDKDKINTLHPEIRDNVTNMLQNLRKDEVTVEITLAYRSYEEQDALYAKGRDEKGEVIDASKVVTNAKGGQSYHNFGLAFDLTVYDKNGKKDWNKDSDAWKKVIAEGKRQGFDAGAEWIDFPDLPHFEKTFGLTPKQLREKKEKNDTKEGFVNVK